MACWVTQRRALVQWKYSVSVAAPLKRASGRKRDEPELLQRAGVRELKTCPVCPEHGTEYLVSRCRGNKFDFVW